MTAFPQVQGRCPACRRTTLILGAGGHVTCAHLDCPNPTAASDLLEQQVAVGTLLICADERHEAKVRGLQAERDGATARVGELAAVLDEVLRSFVHKAHPGRSCLQSQMVKVETVERWHAVLAGNGEVRSV